MSASDRSLNLSKEEPKPIAPENDTHSELGPPLRKVVTTKEDEFVAHVLNGPRRTYTDSIPRMGAGKPYPAALPDREAYRVEFDGEDDPYSPLNWPMSKKLATSVLLAGITFVVTFGSASYSPSVTGSSKEFHVSNVVGTIGVALYVMGFACGPILWGPLCEQLGRKQPIVIGLFLYTCFEFATATCKDIQTLMICRFFSGATGASPLTIVPAAIGDFWEVSYRGSAVSCFAFAVFGGPMLGPVIGGYIADSYLGWRWTLYISGIMGALSLVLTVLFYDESYHPALLSKKATEIRDRIGSWGIYAEHDTVQVDVQKFVTTSLLRPLKMMVFEPILTLLSLYCGFVYGLLYAMLSTVPIIFENYGFKGGNLMLPYIALFLGCGLSTVVSVIFFEPKFLRDLKKSGMPVCPEARLPPMMFGAIIFDIGIFLMCWTGAYPKNAEHPNGCHWILPCIGGAFLGFGLISIFLPILAYLIDTYLALAASAMSANSSLRSIMGAAFPIFSPLMFRGMGIQWAGLLVGCVGLLLTPVPFIFYKWGELLRSKSKYGVNLMDVSREDTKNSK